MFVLKPKDASHKNKGNFVDNLRQTIGILTHTCRWVPKTAFLRKTNHPSTNLPAVMIPHPRPQSPSHISPLSSDLSFPSITRSPSTIAVMDFETQEHETELEAEECVLLDEPMGN
jgi:hypothetical protein